MYRFLITVIDASVMFNFRIYFILLNVPFRYTFITDKEDIKIWKCGFIAKKTTLHQRSNDIQIEINIVHRSVVNSNNIYLVWKRSSFLYTLIFIDHFTLLFFLLLSNRDLKDCSTRFTAVHLFLFGSFNYSVCLLFSQIVVKYL